MPRMPRALSEADASAVAARRRRERASPRREQTRAARLSLELASSEEERHGGTVAGGGAYAGSFERVNSRSPGRTRRRSPGRTHSRSPGRTHSRSPGRARARSPSSTRRAHPADLSGPELSPTSGRSSRQRSRVVQVYEMIDHTDSIPDDELPMLEEEVKADCEDTGPVRSVMIVPYPVDSESAVVYVEFERAADAVSAVTSFNDAEPGSNGDPVTAELFSEAEFDRIKIEEADRRHRTRSRARARHRNNTPAGLAQRLAHRITGEVRAALVENDEDLVSAFDRIDKEGDGYLTALQFRRGLRALAGKGLSPDDVQQLMDEFDASGDSEIDYPEFIAAFQRSALTQQLAGEVQPHLRRQLRQNKDVFVRMLDKFYTTGDGVLTASDIRHVFRKQGLGTAEIDKLMQMFTVHGDEQVDFVEFLEAVLHEAESPSPHRTASSSQVRSPRRGRLSHGGASGVDRHRRAERLTVVRIRDYPAKSLRQQDTRLLEQDIEHDMAEYGAVNDVLIVSPEASSPGAHKLETYVCFATELAAERAQQALRAEGCRAFLLDEEEYEQIEIDQGQGSNSRRRRTWSATPSERMAEQDRVTKAKRLAQVIGRDLREAFPKGADLRSTFRWIDRNGDGVLSHDEFYSGLQEFTGRSLSDDVLNQIIDLFDANGDGEIQYREFCDIFDACDRAEATTKDVLSSLRNQLRSYSNQTDADLLRVFRKLDANGDGRLSRDEFQRGLQDLIQVDLDITEMDDIMNTVDADGDGTIDLNEFLSAASPIPRKRTTSGTTRAMRGQLEVRVIKCANLLPRKGKATAAPGVKMTFGQQVVMSKHETQTLDPKFNFKEMFDVHDDGNALGSNASSTLVVQVCDFALQRLWGGKLLGEVDIDLRKEFGDSWSSGEQHKRHTWPLTDYENQRGLNRRQSESYGSIELEIKFTPIASSTPVADGILRAKIACCKDLIPMASTGQSNPYVIVELEQGPDYEDVQADQTATMSNTVNPLFTHRPRGFRVDYESYSARKCRLRVKVYDENKRTADGSLEGSVELDINGKFNGQWPSSKNLTLRETYYLEDPNEPPRIPVPTTRKRQSHPYGTVEVHLEFEKGHSPVLEPEPEPQPLALKLSTERSTDTVKTEPVCLLRREGGTLRIHSDGKHLLEELKGAPVAVVAIAGLGRTGKSFLLNQLLGRGPSDGGLRDRASSTFGVDMHGGTTGIWCCVVPTERWQYAEAPNTRLLLLDTESLGSSKGDGVDGISWDMQCFTLSVLLSSLLIYTSWGKVDDDAIEQLYMVRELTQLIQVSAAPDSPRSSGQRATGEALARHTPDFLWLLRDFEPGRHYNAGTDSAAAVLDSTELQYHLEEGLEERKPRRGLVERMQEQNQTRASFRRLFPTAKCRALVTPVFDRDDLSNLSALPSHALRPDFLRQVQALCDDIFVMVKPKRQFGQTVSARLLLTLLSSYVKDLNRRIAPDIRKAWDSSEGDVLDDVYLSACEEYENGMEKLNADYEDMYLYECIHLAGVTEGKELGPHPELIAQIEDGETIEVFEQESIDRGSRLGVVDRLRTHCGWVSKEAAGKRLFVEVSQVETREKITVKQVRDCLHNVKRLLEGEITGVAKRNANRKKAQEMRQTVYSELDDQLPEAKTLEWSSGRVAALTKQLRHYAQLQSYDMREADIGDVLVLLQDLSSLQWHAPFDGAAGTAVGVLGGQTHATDYFTTTLVRPAKGGFGINVGHNCEVVNFLPTSDGQKSVAEVAGVLPGMTIVEVNGTPVRDKQGVHAAITRGSSAKTLFKFRSATSSARARSSSSRSGGSTTTQRFDEDAALQRVRLGERQGRQQRRILVSREIFDEQHWQLAAKAVEEFERSVAVPTVETVLRWRQRLDREIKEVYTTKLHELERESSVQCRLLMHELCEGLLRRVHYGSFDYPRGEPDYQRALKETMHVYDREATRRGGPAKDQIAREAITEELPRVYRAFMERQMDIEVTKNRGLETVLERMFESGMGHEDDLATYRRHRYQDDQESVLVDDRGDLPRRRPARRSPGRTSTAESGSHQPHGQPWRRMSSGDRTGRTRRSLG